MIASPSGKRYIGSSVNFNKRRTKHWGMLRRGEHHCTRLQSAWNKHRDKLKFVILLKCRAIDVLFYEQRAIDILKPEYNLAKTAGTRSGVKWSDDARARHKARLNSAETRERMREAARRRKPPSEEHKLKISIGLRQSEAVAISRQKMLGRKASPETRLKLSIMRKGRPSPMKGRKHSVETRAKMSAAHKGQSKPWLKRELSPQHRANIAAALKRRHEGRSISSRRPWLQDGIGRTTWYKRERINETNDLACARSSRH